MRASSPTGASSTGPAGRAHVAVATFAVLLAAAGSPTGVHASDGPDLHATTRSYAFTLTLGMPEHMWTPTQVKMMHPRIGEVTLGGSMATAMPMGSSQRELAVRIDSRATGKPVAGADPAITVIDISINDPITVAVPVDEFERVGAGASDLRYGNNIDLAAGDTYIIIVSLNGEHAVLQATAPESRVMIRASRR